MNTLYLSQSKILSPKINLHINYKLINSILYDIILEIMELERKRVGSTKATESGRETGQTSRVQVNIMIINFNYVLFLLPLLSVLRLVGWSVSLP